MVKKDTFSITGNATINGTKTELNIHVESKDNKPRSPKPQGPSGPPRTSGQVHPKGKPTSPPPSSSQGKAFQVFTKPGQKQGNALTKQKKPGRQPNTNQGTNLQSVAPTQNLSSPGQQNKPTRQVTNTAGKANLNKKNASTKKPGQPKSTNQGSASPSVAPTPNLSIKGQQNKPTGQVTNAAGEASQNQCNTLTNKPGQHKTKTNPRTNSQSVTPTQNLPKITRQNKPTNQVRKCSGKDRTNSGKCIDKEARQTTQHKFRY